MQQGWGPQGPMGGSVGPMMGQTVAPGRMIPNMSAAMPSRGPPGSRGMVGMQMMASGEESLPDGFRRFPKILDLAIHPFYTQRWA